MHHVLSASSYWETLATGAGQVGRWVWDQQTDEFLIDKTLSAITGIQWSEEGREIAIFMDHVHPDDLASVIAAADRSEDPNKAYSARFRFLRADGEEIWLEGRGQSVTLDDGAKVLIGVNYDITAQMKLVKTNELLVGEMNHRVKNILALISGIFRMAARLSTDVNALSEGFLGRLHALGRLNDFILSSSDRSVWTRSLVDAVFEPVGEDDRVRLEVENIELSGAAAQLLILTLNELFTNAMKHGALADVDGKLNLSISTDREADKYRLVWTEHLSYQIAPPEKSNGFGLLVLLRMTRATASGQPQLEWRKDGMMFTCDWTASEMAPGKDEAVVEDVSWVPRNF